MRYDEHNHMDIYDDTKRIILPEDLLGRIRVKKLGELYGTSFYLVDGTVIRQEVDIDFLFGGHYGRDRFIPKNEVWVEQVIPWVELVAILAHEYYEMGMMVGNGKSYDAAHEAATQIERGIRQGNRYSSSDVFADFVYVMKRIL